MAPLSTARCSPARSLSVAVPLLAALLSTTPLTAEPPAQVAPFELRDFRGKTWNSTQADGKLLVVAFLGVECPLVRVYAKRLEQLRADFADRGVVVVGVNSNLQDTLTEMASFARRHHLQFPYLKDPGNAVADAFQAERTPEVFVLDADRRVQYRGRIDDQYTYGLQRPKPTRRFLREALEQLLDGKQVATPSTETVGCHIGRVLTPQRDSDVTYSSQIARIFQRRCVECHREGEIGPFPLTSYEESVGWAEMIYEVTHERRMPPWHAEGGHQQYQNDARLSDKELALIREWVDAGAPEGDPQNLPAPRKFERGWRIGKPDKIVWMSEQPFDVPAEGEVAYQHFVSEYVFEEDTWVQAAECRPGNREVVHHIIVGVTKKDREGVHGQRSAWLAATAPGARPLMLPEGQAKLIPAGSRLVFQMHYTPNGVATEDRSSIGLRLVDASEVKHQVLTHQAAKRDIEIPAHASNHREEAKPYTFRRDSYLRSLFPHLHLRGKSFRYTAHYPDGAEEILLDVPHYDFNWQNSYDLIEPKWMPRGTRIECVAHYDNSEDNLANPAPHQTIKWGPQTWDEMMIGYFDIYEAAGVDRTRTFLNQADAIDRRALRAAAKQAPASEQDFEKFAQALKAAMPQIDRVDWITVEGDRMQVRLIAAGEPFASTDRGKTTVRTAGMELPKIIAAGKPRVYQDLSQAPGKDLSFMHSHAFNSSVHLPLPGHGRPGVFSVWSVDRDAFPPEAVKLLGEVTSGDEAASGK